MGWVGWRGGWWGGKKVIHSLQAVICTEQIKENGMEPFCLNDIGLNVCRGNCQFAWASPGAGWWSLSLALTNVRIKSKSLTFIGACKPICHSGVIQREALVCVCCYCVVQRRGKKEGKETRNLFSLIINSIFQTISPANASCTFHVCLPASPSVLWLVQAGCRWSILLHWV